MAAIAMTATDNPTPPTMSTEDIAKGPALDAHEKFGGLEVIYVGPMFSEQVNGETHYVR
jgi:hypothetical protein